jgi:uncharacterized protein YigA (DUF484 family)
MRLNAEDVAQYLKNNPAFFDEYAEMLTEIQVPHPHGGRAIPIAERQLVTLRDRNRLLEDKLREFVRFGQENDRTIERVHRLTVDMLAASDAATFLPALSRRLHEDFSLSGAAVRVWTPMPGAGAEFEPVSTEARVFAESLTDPYLTPTAMFETLDWFGAPAARLASFGYVGLRVDRTFGLLALASDDPGRFNAEMGLLYLKRLGELVSAAIARLLGLRGDA